MYEDPVGRLGIQFRPLRPSREIANGGRGFLLTRRKPRRVSEVREAGLRKRGPSGEQSFQWPCSSAGESCRRLAHGAKAI
jgi:hypothetical protein